MESDGHGRLGSSGALGAGESELTYKAPYDSQINSIQQKFAGISISSDLSAAALVVSRLEPCGPLQLGGCAASPGGARRLGRRRRLGGSRIGRRRPRAGKLTRARRVDSRQRGPGHRSPPGGLPPCRRRLRRGRRGLRRHLSQCRPQASRLQHSLRLGRRGLRHRHSRCRPQTSSSRSQPRS